MQILVSYIYFVLNLDVCNVGSTCAKEDIDNKSQNS
mgnify:CR=1 FL=1